MTVSTFAVDENEDFVIGPDGNLKIVYGLEAVLMLCQSVAKTQLGELVLNTDQGMPTLQTVWAGTTNFLQFESAFRANISRIQGVSEIVSFNTDITGGVFTYQAVIKTIYGTGEING